VAGHPLTVGAILQNPSVANAAIADKSVQFLEKLVFLQGLPQFAGRRADNRQPVCLDPDSGVSGTEMDIGADNDRHIEQAIAESDVILVAWGKSNAHTTRKQVINRMLRNQRDKLLLQGKSHPSRAGYSGYVSSYDESDL